MPDEVVRVIYQVDGTAPAKRGVDALADSVDRSTGSAARAEGAFGGLSRSLMGYLGFRQLLGDVREAGAAILKLQDEAEVATTSIAGMFQASGVGGLTGTTEDWNVALGMSSEIIARMRKDARDLPGTFQDLQNVFQGAILGGAAAGKSALDIEGLSARMMAVAKVLNVPSEVAGREFQMMMEGRAGAHNALWQRLKGNIGATAEEFNQLSAADKWARVDKALVGYDHAVKDFARTWSAISSTTADYAANVARIGSDQAFSQLKDILKEINDYYEQHREQVDAMARQLGGELADGIRKSWGVAKDVIAWIIDHKDELKVALEGLAVLKLTSIAGGLGMGAGGKLAGGALSTLAMTAVGAEGAALMLEAHQSEQTSNYAEVGALDAALKRANYTSVGSASTQLTAIRGLQEEGPLGPEQAELQRELARRIVGETGTIAAYAREMGIKGADQQGLRSVLQRMGLDEEQAGERAAKMSALLAAYGNAMAALPHVPGASAVSRPTAAKPNINVTNHNRFETQINQADNPDRAFVDLKKAVRDATLFPKETPRQIASVLR